MLRRHVHQSPHKHAYTYTGLMTCAYCGYGVTAETRILTNGTRWIQYHCTNPHGTCTRRGLSESQVEANVIAGLESIIIDPELTKIALDNIMRELDAQTEPVQALYSQQNRTLEDIEEQLKNLVKMWTGGLLKDKQRYQEMEDELLNEKNNLLVEAEKSRQELEKMRANAKSSANYIMFARDNFMVADMQRKREIAHALGFKYVFFGKEKKIELALDPILAEVVSFARKVEASIELQSSDSHKETTGKRIPVGSFGGPGGS